MLSLNTIDYENTHAVSVVLSNRAGDGPYCGQVIGAAFWMQMERLFGGNSNGNARRIGK